MATRLDNAGLMAAVEAGIAGLLRRTEAVPATLAAAVKAAASGNGTVPPDLLGKLLDQMGWLQRQVLAPRGLSMNGLAERELAVLRLVADGYDTHEIAKTLSYSERTVKNVIHDITVRLNLRNRSRRGRPRHPPRFDLRVHRSHGRERSPKTESRRNESRSAQGQSGPEHGGSYGGTEIPANTHVAAPGRQSGRFPPAATR